MGFKFKKVTKSVKKTVKNPGSVVKRTFKETKRGYDKLEDEVNRAYDDFENGVKGAIAGSPFGPFGMIVGFATGSGLAGSMFRDFGQIAGALGLNSLEREFNRMGRDSDAFGAMVNGDLRKDLKRYDKKKKQVEAYQERVEEEYERFNAELDEFSDRLSSLVAFGEIFHLAISNRMESLIDEKEPELKAMADQLDVMIEELNKLTVELQENYDFALGLMSSGGFITKFIVSVIMITDGLVRDFKDIVRGQTDGTTWKSFGRGVLAIIATVVAVMAAFGGDGGTSLYLVIAAVTTSITTLMVLDGLYAGGIATNGIFTMLDFLFNDILNSDEWITEKMDRLDPDHEEHQKMVVVVQLLLMVTALITGLAGSWNSPAPTPSKVPVDSYLGGFVKIGDTMAKSSIAGVSFVSLWSTFQIALSVNDYLEAKEAYDEMKKKLEDARKMFETEITSHLNKRMMGHYKDSAYFLQDQQEFIDRYIWSMTASSMYVDPYGTTPVANMRFNPNPDTRMMNFGFEDVFDEETQAGSRSYFNGIIYGS